MAYDKLRRMRIQCGMSQQEMANLLGLTSKNGYSLKERGERRFDVDEAITIARELNASVEELFFRFNSEQNGYEDCL